LTKIKHSTRVNQEVKIMLAVVVFIFWAIGGFVGAGLVAWGVLRIYNSDDWGPTLILIGLALVLVVLPISMWTAGYDLGFTDGEQEFRGQPTFSLEIGEEYQIMFLVETHGGRNILTVLYSFSEERPIFYETSYEYIPSNLSIDDLIIINNQKEIVITMDI